MPGALLVSAVGLAVAWLFFQHIPAWYQPIWLSRNEAEAVRERAEQIFEIVTEKMVAGEPFSITFTARQINELLSVQELIWPMGATWLDSGFEAPCVDIRENHLNLGMRYRWGQIQSILSLKLTAKIQNDQLDIQVVSAKAGSLPVRASMFLENFSARKEPGIADSTESSPRATESSSLLQGSMERLFNAGRSISPANRFEWSNGGIAYKIVGLKLRPGTIQLQVMPLTR